MTDRPDEPDSPAVTPRRCLGVTARGACLMRPLAGSDWCWNHSEAHAAQRDAARRLGGQRGSRRATGPVPDGLTLRDVPSIQAVFEQALRDCLALDNSVQRARTVGYLGSLALQALEIGSIEERLAALEAAAGQRRAS